MNCTDFERLIALDVEGDLPVPTGRATAEHLLACTSCQQFAEQLKISQALVKELGQEPLDEPMVQEVRRRVRNRLESERQPRDFQMWRLALGGGLIAALIFAVLILRHHSPGAVTPIVAERSTPANAPLPSRASKDEPRNSKIDARPAKSAQAAKDFSVNRREGGRSALVLPATAVARAPKSGQNAPSSKSSSSSLRASPNAEHPQPLTVKLITDNPNVVIYLLGD